MLFSAQFPFVDLRKFIDNTGQLEYPLWPLPTPDAEFVRYFGSIRIRKLGGVDGWVGESEICEAGNALRFSTGLKYTASSSDISILLRCAFRRLYFDGKAVGKYEVGICPKKRASLKLTKEQFQEFMEYCLQLPVLIRNPNGIVEGCSLIYASKSLVHLCTNATTSQSFLEQPQDWWVLSGVPLLFLEFSEKDDIKIPYWSKPVFVSEEYEFKIFHCLVPHAGFNFRTWILVNSGIQRPWIRHEYNRARALRISLLRLHAEHECLRLTLRNILNKRLVINPRSSQSDVLQDYLNTATARISKLEAASNKNFDTDVIEIARESFHTINPGQRDNLLQILENLDVRKNVFRKLERYTNQWVGSKEVIYMVNEGDTYNIGQAGAAGRNASAYNSTFFQSEQKQTLSEAAAEIQKLLKQLEKSNPTATEDEKIAYVNDETTPSFKRRVVGALQAGSEAVIEEFLDNPYVNVGKAVVKGWIKPEL